MCYDGPIHHVQTLLLYLLLRILRIVDNPGVGEKWLVIGRKHFGDLAMFCILT